MPSRVIKNYFFLLLTNIINLSSHLMVTMLIAKSWGTSGFGQISFILSFTTLFTFMTNWGLNLLIIRNVARDKEEVTKYLNNSLVLTGILSFFTFWLIAILVHFTNYPVEIIRGVYIGSLYIIAGAFTSLFRGVFHAYESMKYETYALFVERIANVIICFIVLKLGGGIVQVMISFLAARTLNLFVSVGIYFIKINRTISIKVNPSFLIFLCRTVFPFGLNILLTSAYIQADIVILSLMKGDSATGLYRAATSLIIPLTFLATSLNSALYPRMSYLFKSSPKQLVIDLSKSFRYLTQLSLLIMSCIIIAADKIIFTIYTREFNSSILLLRILAFVIPIRFLNNSLGVALTSIDKQGLRTLSVASGAIFNLISNFVLIFFLSYIGASISTVLTDLIIFILLYFFLFKHSYQKIPLLRSTIKPIIICAVVSLLALYFRNVNFIFIICLAIILYITSLYLLGDFPEEDLARVRAFISKRKSDL